MPSINGGLPSIDTISLLSAALQFGLANGNNDFYYFACSRFRFSEFGMRDSLEKKDLLVAKEAAEILRIDMQTMWKYAREAASNGMPVIRIGRQVRFPRERFLKWAGLGDQ